MTKALTSTEVKKRLWGYFNYKRLYSDLKERFDREKEKRKESQEEVKKWKRKADELKVEIKDLKGQLEEMAKQKAAKKPRFSENYSVSRQEKKRHTGERKKSPGRTPKANKMDQVNEEVHLYPEGVKEEDCLLSHTRYVTHLKRGQKCVMHYHLYKSPWGQPPSLPGVMPRGEYGIEVAVVLAFLVYMVEISIDQARNVMAFFTGIELSRSQADSLLNQVSRLWEPELEKISTLITLAYLIHIDETGWKVGKKNCYAWVFTNLAHTLFLYGKNRSEETLEQVLSRSFSGIVITDFFSTYEKYFKNQQKCWAHALRDAIKLMLMYPEKKEYKQFFDKLQHIFRIAKGFQKDDQLTRDQREKKVLGLKQRVRNLCTRVDEKIPKEADQDWRDYVNLHKRLMKYMRRDHLFTFVKNPYADPTNNRAEQKLRKTAKARNNYQTSKTAGGARRRSVIASVLTTLEQNLPHFSLQSVIEEVTQWRIDGLSLFDRHIFQAQRASPD